jgi:hypothetical protein
MRAAMMPVDGAGHEPPSAIRRVLAWLARLPLLTEAQLGALAGEEDQQVRALLRLLAQQGLVQSVIADSPEFAEALRLYHLTKAGERAAARRVGVGVTDLARSLPMERDEHLSRLARVETAVGVTDTLAMLADAARRAERADGTAPALDDAGGTHWAPHRGRPDVFPPSCEAWVRLRAGNLRATALLAWDRAGAPRAHRRARIAAWYRADERRDAPWGPSLPPILMVCPHQEVAAQWHDLVDASAASRGRPLLRIGVTTVSELVCQGPLAHVWRRPHDGTRVGLADILTWQDMPLTLTWPEPTVSMTHQLAFDLSTANGGDEDVRQHAPSRAGAETLCLEPVMNCSLLR